MEHTGRLDRRWLDLQLDEDHDYPFSASKHLNPVGVNREPVRCSQRLIADHDHLGKLRDPSKPPPPSKTNYEAYLKGRDQRKCTTGRFAADPDRLAVVRHPAEHQIDDYKNLMKLNPSLQASLVKMMAFEDKKLEQVHQARMFSDGETKSYIQRADK